jgi:hypothetical protein
MRAYVTGGDPPVDDAQTSAMRARLRPHATSRGRAQGSRHTSGAKACARTACRR